MKSRGRIEREKQDPDRRGALVLEYGEDCVDCWFDVGEPLLLANVDASEVYSGPRMAVAAQTKGLVAGSRVDIAGVDEQGTQCLFDNVRMRNHAVRRVTHEHRFLLVGPAFCGAWNSTMQRHYCKLSPEDKGLMLARARRPLQFVCQLYRLQHQAGRYFLPEHPIGAQSWKEEVVNRVMEATEATILVIDQCMHGFTSIDDDGIKRSARETLGMMTNMPALARTPHRRCSGRHKHA